MFGIETQGGKSGRQKAGLLLNITERESGAGNGREERDCDKYIEDCALHCHTLFFKKFLQRFNSVLLPPKVHESSLLPREQPHQYEFRDTEISRVTVQVRFQV